MIHQVHEASDWVLTIDRNMGIEFYDHGGHRPRPDYLIDHSPNMSSGSGYRMAITSKSMMEIRAILKNTLERYGIPAEEKYAATVLDQIRSLSGRLALKLVSAPSQRAEALGLAVARMFLEYQGVFSNQIVLPLDAHLELYRVLQKSKNDMDEEISFKRTDLALFDLDANRRTIKCNLVEVKCYSHVGSFGAYNQLRESVAQQIFQTEQVLQHHFDPNRTPKDRPDRFFKIRELVSILEFYLDRSARFGMIRPDAENEARFFLRTLEDGYELVFTRSAIILDFDKQGTDPVEKQGKIEFYRIGVDKIRELIDETVNIREDGLITLAASETITIPKFDVAAFAAKERDRSVSWDDCRRSGDTIFETKDQPPERNVPKAAESENPEEPEERLSTNTDSDEMSGELRETLAVFKDRAEAESPEPMVSPDIILGVGAKSPQFGVLGEASGRKIAIDLNETHTISLFGVQGGGKSYTLGTIVEMATMPIPHINMLPKPLASVIFHYSSTQDYQPEFTSMIAENSDGNQLRLLRERYGAAPKALDDVILLTPEDKVTQRRKEYPGIEVHSLKFAASELQAGHWQFLMGAVGNQAVYIRQLKMIMRSMRGDMTVNGLSDGIKQSSLPDHLKDLARVRLELAGQYLDDTKRLGSLIIPGRLIIVDLRDEYIEKDEALGLFIVLLQIFADAKHEGRPFNKLIVFDECHKYIDSPDLVSGLVEIVREMRHKGVSILVASQDPKSVPIPLIELSSQIILHKFNSPDWLKHIQKANTALGELTSKKMAHLEPGEAYVWSSKATDDAFANGTVKITCRPRVTRHGGATKTAVK